jgi:hypothetical protein
MRGIGFGRSAALLAMMALVACSGPAARAPGDTESSGGNDAISGGVQAGPQAIPSAPPDQALPDLRGLPSRGGTPLRSASTVVYELLDHAPVLSSGGASALYEPLLLTLDPSQNGGLAWAVFELYDFPSDGSIAPEAVSTFADAGLYVGVSDYGAGTWRHQLLSPVGSVALQSGGPYHNDNGSMYVAVVATEDTVGLESLRVDTPLMLENGDYAEHEDNDTRAAAEPLPAFAFGEFSGSIGAGGYDGDDNDYFSFDSPEGRLADLRISYDPGLANISMTLYEEDGSTMVKDDQGNTGERRIAVGRRREAMCSASRR